MGKKVKSEILWPPWNPGLGFFGEVSLTRDDAESQCVDEDAPVEVKIIPVKKIARARKGK